MNPAATQRFRVLNLDCAACGAKIEERLKQTEGVEEAALDFTNLTLHLKARDLTKALEAVRLVEPQVELIPAAKAPPITEAVRREGSFRRIRQTGILAAAVLIFIVFWFFEEPLNGTAWAWVEYPTALAAYLLAGWNVVAAAVRTIRRGAFFDENVLMVIATGGAFAIHALAEAVGVMLFYKAGELLQEKAISRSRRSISALLAVQPRQAVMLSDTGWSTVKPEEVTVGATILVKPGEKISLDGTVLTGDSHLDSSPLTGESLPTAVQPGDGVMAGALNLTGALTIKVTKPFGDSSIAKILDLVQNAAARKANTEKFITRFARYYTPAVVFGAACIAFIPPLFMSHAHLTIWIYRALVLLVISCPCALVISVPLGYFGGIGRASRRGILVKGSNFIDVLSQVSTVAFDKTGTLTKGVFEVRDIVSANGFTQRQVLDFAAAAEMHSNHPIAASILKTFFSQGGYLDMAAVTDHSAIAGQGVRASYEGREITIGNDRLLHRNDVPHDQCAFEDTVAHVVVDGTYAGYLLIGDQLKADARQAVSRLRKNGIREVIMLTGDNHCTAAHVAEVLSLDRFHADLLPEDKVRILESIAASNEKDGKVAFVGDGINDAPVLARADVGVAMGALGSDAAIETADVVLMTDSPAKMAEAVSIARKTRRIVWENILIALAVKSVFIAFGAFGLATMWEAVFADMGTALAAVLNATRTLGNSLPD